MAVESSPHLCESYKRNLRLIFSGTQAPPRLAGRSASVLLRNALTTGELVDDRKTGILVPVGDHEKLAAALNLLIEDVPLRQRMGEAGYTSVLASHRIEDMSRKYIQLFVGNSA